jgi:hypothetical protein
MASTEIEIVDPAATVDKTNKIAADRALNRRRFITALGMTGAAAGAAALMSGCTNASTGNVAVNTSGVAQTNLLNFLLNLQYLEATLYSYITTGADISGTSGVNLTGTGAVTGTFAQLTLTGTNAAQVTDMLNEICYDEINHVTLLQSILGSAVVPRPAINLAAFGTITATNGLSIGRLLEDVGVTACAGLLPGLSSSSATFAGQILGADSFHSGVLRLLSVQSSATTLNAGDGLDVPPYDLSPAATAALGPNASGGYFASAGGAIASTNTSAGIAYTRTASQALAVLYGALASSAIAIVPAAAGSKSGGFFPNGVNGAITTI